jgi:dethiobiotin synthetase
MVFITGTDTGVGKTLLTALLLHHLRQGGCRALAMKPFCSGGRADVDFLHAVQDGELTHNEINPYFFSEPIAPLAAAQLHHRSIRLSEVLRRIRKLAGRCECLLIEGIGGVMVPLGEGFFVLDLIASLACQTTVVAPNRLGTINHTLLTVGALQDIGIKRLKVVLMASPETDPSTRFNRTNLGDLLAPTPVLLVPFLGRNLALVDTLKATQKKIKKTLARILA